MKNEKLKEIMKHQKDIINNLENKLEFQKNENYDLQQKINKAIEYINWSLEANEELTDMGIGLCVNNVEVLLEILEGSDK